MDDPRNTDNAWMETVAFNFHDDTGRSVGRFSLHAGESFSSHEYFGFQSFSLFQVLLFEIGTNCTCSVKILYTPNYRLLSDLMLHFLVFLSPGDDAVGVRWTDISSNLKLFASHEMFIKQTAELHKAHW